MGGPRKADWDKVREQYVTGGDEVTWASLAVEHGVSRETVHTHAKEEGWGEQRKEYRQGVHLFAREKQKEVAGARIASQTQSIADQVFAVIMDLGECLLDAECKPGAKQQLAIALGISVDKFMIVTGQVIQAEKAGGDQSSERVQGGRSFHERMQEAMAREKTEKPPQEKQGKAE